MARVKTTQRAERTLFSWRDDPLPPRDRSLRQSRYRLIDAACESLTELPTMRGLLMLEPRLASTFIRACSRKKLGVPAHYLIGKNACEVNFGYEGSCPAFNESFIEGLLSHEYRHAYQDLRKSLGFHTNANYDRYPKIQIAFDRITEADATVFSIVLAYEEKLITGNSGVLRAIEKYDRASSVRAYKQSAEDERNHWNGAAAASAFAAYFKRYNAGLQKSYDLDRSRTFKKIAKTKQLDLSEDKLAKAFRRYASPMSLMPYESNGVLFHRFHYREPAEMTVRELLPHLSRQVRQELSRLAA